MNVASSSSHIVPFAAFFFSGRFSVIVTMPDWRATSRVSMGAKITLSMGLDPYRPRRAPGVFEYTMVGLALIACLALVLWAVL